MSAFNYVLLLLVGALAACQTPPKSIVTQPLSARPQMPAYKPATNGAIYQANSIRPLFEDRIPRNVGDTLTVVIEEKSSTQTREETGLKRDSNYSMTGPSVKFPYLGGLTGKLAGIDLSAGSSASNSGTGKSASSNQFTGSITVTVIEELQNGNLVVSGEKQMSINGDTEFIRLSGIVNPRDIRPGNTLSSTKLGDARVELQKQGNNHAFAQPGWLGKFFMTILPF